MKPKQKQNFILCVKCKDKIYDGDGRFNYPTGQECTNCGDPTTKKKPKFTKIAGYNIPTKKLEEYRDVVEYTRRAAIMGRSRDDPLIVMRALENRVKIHKAIFKITGHDHDSTAKEPTRIRHALDEWLEKNVMTKPQKNGLV